MKEILGENNNTQSSKEDIEGIKKDVASLVHRLANIKDNAREIVSEQLDNLSEVITDLRVKAINTGRGGLADLYFSTRKYPLRNLAYACGIGMVVAYFIKKS